MDKETTNLEQLAIEERRAYFKKWRANNKEKVKQHNQNYWKRRAEKRLQEAEKECS